MEPVIESIFPERPVVYARFWARFWAAFVDEFFVFIAWFIIAQSVPNAMVSIISIAIALLYNPLMEASPRQATLGKTGLRIKVTDLDGNRITYGQAFGRHFGKILSAGILFAGFFMMLWTGKRQALHDRIAGTLVVAD